MHFTLALISCLLAATTSATPSGIRPRAPQNAGTTGKPLRSSYSTNNDPAAKFTTGAVGVAAPPKEFFNQNCLTDTKTGMLFKAPLHIFCGMETPASGQALSAENQQWYNVPRDSCWLAATDDKHGECQAPLAKGAVAPAVPAKTAKLVCCLG